VTVTFKTENLPDVDVEPHTLLLHEGDTAFVEFVDVPNDCIVAFWYPADGSTQGPFSTYFVTRKNGSGTVRLGGATFGSSPDSTISYGVRIWNAAGELVGSKDPSIDNLGRPPGT
jgi:hypothetical protein